MTADGDETRGRIGRPRKGQTWRDRARARAERRKAAGLARRQDSPELGKVKPTGQTKRTNISRAIPNEPHVEIQIRLVWRNWYKERWCRFYLFSTRLRFEPGEKDIRETVQEIHELYGVKPDPRVESWIERGEQKLLDRLRHLDRRAVEGLKIAFGGYRKKLDTRGDQ